MFRRFIDNLVLKALTEEIGKIADSARKNVSAKRLPYEIVSAISVSPAEVIGDGRYQIAIDVDLQEAPMAAAFEWGSGLHATRGVAMEYDIKAKNAPVLSFLWKYPSPLGRKYIVPEDEQVSFIRISHPGVAPRPYLQPAIDKNKLSLQSRLIDVFVTSLLQNMKVEFKDVAKK
jgi:hypothetical protein